MDFSRVMIFFHATSFKFILLLKMIDLSIPHLHFFIFLFPNFYRDMHEFISYLMLVQVLSRVGFIICASFTLFLQVTKMLIKVDLQCSRCYKKIKWILCKFSRKLFFSIYSLNCYSIRFCLCLLFLFN